jgi:hypothetical protein
LVRVRSRVQSSLTAPSKPLIALIMLRLIAVNLIAPPNQSPILSLLL